MVRRAAILAVLAAILGLTIGPGTAVAANTVTVGASLAEPPLQVSECSFEAGCGLAILDGLGPSSGAVAPFDGTVTAWRLGGASATPGYTISTLRENGDGSFTVTATEAPVTPAGDPVETFPAHLPVRQGEFIAVSVPYQAGISLVPGSSLLAGFAGVLHAGETRTPIQELQSEGTLGFNVDIEESAPAPPAATTAPPAAGAPPAAAPVIAVAETPHCLVPRLTGRTLRAAKAALRRAGCGIGFVIRRHARGGARRHRNRPLKVRRESPRPGRTLPVGTQVSIALG